MNRESFAKEIDQAHEILFTSWLPKGDLRLKHNIFAALGLMAGLQSEERLYKHSAQVVTVLIGNYKRTPEPYHVTDSLSQLIDAVVEKNPGILEPVIMQLLTAIFLQVRHLLFQLTSQFPARRLRQKSENISAILRLFYYKSGLKSCPKISFNLRYFVRKLAQF